MRIFLIGGILLIALGIVSLVCQGIPYKTDTEVVQFGPIQASAETTKTIPFPPALGILALVGGGCLVAMRIREGPRKSSGD